MMSMINHVGYIRFIPICHDLISFGDGEVVILKALKAFLQVESWKEVALVEFSSLQLTAQICVDRREYA